MDKLLSRGLKERKRHFPLFSPSLRGETFFPCRAIIPVSPCLRVSVVKIALLMTAMPLR
jgi:hypothetical protein